MEKSKGGRAARRRQWWQKYQETQAENENNKDETPSEKPKPSVNHALKSKTDKITDSSIKADNSEDKSPSTTESSKKEKQEYFVLFLGNLPYDVKKEDVMLHFRQTRGIKDVRLLTDKTTGKSRGCGYIEFTNPESHKLGLRLHHSELKGRKINVEFTSVGRKSEKRTDRLKRKNKQAQRFRNIVPKNKRSLKKNKNVKS